VTERDDGESIPAFQTLDEPTRLLGIALSGWVAMLCGGGLGYGWLLVSPLGWRANVSLVVVAVGVPAGLLLVREQSTVSPGRLLLAVIRWRARNSQITAVSDQQPVRRGGVVLDQPPDRPLDAAYAGAWARAAVDDLDGTGPRG
jgi:hypothetical protein